MKISDLQKYVYDEIIIYKEENEKYIDIYNGNIQVAPLEILALNVVTIGANKTRVLDIRVK